MSSAGPWLPLRLPPGTSEPIPLGGELKEPPPPQLGFWPIVLPGANDAEGPRRAPVRRKVQASSGASVTPKSTQGAEPEAGPGTSGWEQTPSPPQPRPGGHCSLILAPFFPSRSELGLYL